MVKDLTNSLKNNRYIALALLLVVNLFFILKLTSFREILIYQKAELASVKYDLRSLDQLNSDYSKAEEKLLKVLSSLPSTYFDVASLTYKLEDLAVSSGLSIELSFEKDAGEDKGVKYVDVKIDTSGGYQNYWKFIGNLSDLPYNTQIVRANFVNDNGVLSQDTVVRVYLQK